MYQMAMIYSKWPKNLFHSKALQTLPKLHFFGLKINHLATLPQSPSAAFSAQFVSQTFYFFAVAIYPSHAVFFPAHIN
jgi:hypothetical protein